MGGYLESKLGNQSEVTGNDATRLIIESGLLVGRCRVLIEQTQMNVERSDLLVRVSRALRLQQRELRAFRTMGSWANPKTGPSVNSSSTWRRTGGEGGRDGVAAGDGARGAIAGRRRSDPATTDRASRDVSMRTGKTETEADFRLRSVEPLRASNGGMDRSTCRAASDRSHRTWPGRTRAIP